MRVFLLSLATSAAIALSLTAPASAQTDARRIENQRFQACIELIDTDPDAALNEAQIWHQTGGGWPPEVCAGRAMIALGEADLGAGMLDNLASEPRAGMSESDRVALLVLAAEGYIQARETGDALAAYSSALELQPDAIAPRVGRAGIELEEGDIAALAIDANHLVSMAPGLAEGWRLRSEYHLARGEFDNARADMQRARELEPERIDLLVLRGRINEARRLAALEN